MKLISIEDQIIKITIKALLDVGYVLSVNDGEETTVYRSANIAQIFEAMKTTEEDYLLVYDGVRGDSRRGPGGGHGWVRFIYGNDDTEVINDYTTNLEPVMAPIFKMINETRTWPV